MRKLFDITGKTISGEWGSNDDDKTGIPVIRTTNFTNEGNIDYSNVVTRKIKKNNIEKKFLKYGDIIIEKSGGSDNQPVGRVVYFDNKDGKYLFNNFTGLLRVKDTSKWNSRYVFWSLFASYKQGKTKMYQNKTTGLHNLRTDAYVKDLNIKDLSFKSQVNISNILDKARKEIELRKEELAKLDTLIKARFVEMFGTTNDNIFNYPVVRLGECVSLQGGYAFKSKDFVDNGIKLVQIGNVNKDYLDWKTVNRVPKDFVNVYKDFQLKENDLLIALTRPIIKSIHSVKLAKVSKSDLPCLLNQRVGRFIILKRLNPYFLEQLCKMDDFRYYVEQMSSNSLQPNISGKQVEEYKIILPPIELQNEFASFVQQVDKSKVVNASIMKYIISIRFYLYFKENKEGAR